MTRLCGCCRVRGRKAARGEKVAGFDIEPGEAGDAVKLQGAKRVLSVAEVEASSDKHGYLRSAAVVFPDGVVRWVDVSHRTEAASVKTIPISTRPRLRWRTW